jgi:hypothetical protein
MTLTPIVAETATASATMATPVRLRLAPISDTASRAQTPPASPANGASSAVDILTTSGTHSANPRINMNTAARPATRLRPDSANTQTATTIVPAPVNATTGRSRLECCSRTDRTIARRGWYDAASMAGTAAANSDAPTPAATPLPIDAVLIEISVTDTRK